MSERTATDTRKPEWLTRAEVALCYRIAQGTLEGWASRGEGPRYARVGKKALYRVADVERFFAERMVEPLYERPRRSAAP